MTEKLRGIVEGFDKKQIIVKIKVATNDFEYFADVKLFSKYNLPTPNVGDEIYFCPGTPQGNRIKVSKILPKDTYTNEEREERFEKTVLPRPNNQSNQKNSDFTNPYSFVPVLLPLPNKRNSFKKSFVDHDKYEDLSGTIVCKITTLSPFFIAETHLEENNHKILDFLSFDRKDNNWRLPVIPGSTLRGVIRSISEAASNSTYTAISSEILDYRALSKANKLKCGQIVELPKDGKPGKIKVLESAKLKFGNIPEDAIDTGKGWAKIESTKNGKKLAVSCSTEKSNTEQKKEGYFKLTGENLIDTKKHERFFFEKNNSPISFSL
ncbi:MAG: hypothetical protein JNN15_12410 [Blastocatellia bacterium]|nr:hypothetical protein [Blastocatellia bacterium]